MMRRTAFIGAAVVLAAGAALSDTDVTHLWELKQQARIKAVDDALDGVLGVATIDLTSGRIFVYNADAVFPTASSIKIPIMIQVFRDERAGKFSFEDKVSLGPRDNAGGSGGPLQKALEKGSVTVTVRDLLVQRQFSDKQVDQYGRDGPRQRADPRARSGADPFAAEDDGHGRGGAGG